MIDAMLGIALGAVFIAGVYGVWTWQNFSRKMAEYNDLAADYDALFEWWLKSHQENIELRQKYELWEGGDAHGNP